MSRLLIISNRLPVNISKEKGQLRIERSVGGLATGIGSVYKSQESLWVGWPGYNLKNLQKEEREQVLSRLQQEKCKPVFLTPHEIKQYYGGFCNNIVWPLFHYFNLYAKYDPNYWSSYVKVNEKFCAAVMEVAKPDDVFWVHDYQLMLLPQMIRERLPNAKIGFFFHIPFPSYEVFRLLPWRSEVLSGMLGADLVGFHTYDYVRHFLSSVRRILGFEHSLNEVQTGTRLVRVDLFPMGIDYNRYSNGASSSRVQKEVERLRRKTGKQKIILSSDRLDYTKGIPLRLEAFDALLSQKAEYRGKVSMILVTVPSRSNVAQYQALRKRIDELVGRINGKYGTTDWLPVRYFNRFLPFEQLVAFYSLADVGLVTPIRDGMNLMSKEFIACKVNGAGMLILSEMTGAAQELGEALIVNPNNQGEIVKAIEKALTTPIEEQQRINRVMQKRLKRYDIARWAQDFLNRLDDAWIAQEQNTQHVMTTRIRTELINSYNQSKRRLIMLDYDGTLVPFADKPEKAVPTAESKEALKALSEPPENEVVLISGRDRNTLQNWFGSFDICLIGEHGAWMRERSGKTRAPRLLSNEWKDQIFPLLELYTDRTPGSLLEEKPYSLVWHYRKADPVLASLRANELKDDLMYLTSNLGLAVVEGKKVIEIKNATVNKGLAAQNWLSKQDWDFILAIGDDKTDEDLFEVLPSTAYSVKVGLDASKARFNVISQRHVIPLLRELVSKKAQVEKTAKT
ncbi:MAG: bifunctional alpha,alpha-trehalose-phosphate synthase (UDP-forming)/trehalose-phosphatase [Candidatus Bathyarchaeota archaeon]|nr:bifunctional alpha,alpha-trehalose-phosphate synthase (UDP-forming)/trehalose-phosphatase [Candidatus Bathyarchaeota archaeon]